MSIQQKPISELIRGTECTEDEPKKRSREDFKKEKELEELRKAGTVPALVDEEGKDINPHIPQYISSVPWYYGSSGPTLKHQRPQDEDSKSVSRVDEWYPRGKTNKMATKFRKGACENCGAMGHNRKACFERPRKIPAKVSGIVVAPDDPDLPDLKLDYDGKRDRWNGYDPKMYKEVVEEYIKLEEAKKVLKEEKLKEELIMGDAETKEKVDSDSDADEEEEKYADHIDMPGTKVDSKQRITVRNLRIREDTAKYLRNLDPDSAYYDPKTRSMRDNPYKNKKNPADLPYAGENAVRYSGDTIKVSQMQLFAWEARDKGADINLLAEPTKAEVVHKKYQEQKNKFKTSIKKSILEKYGGEEYLQEPPKELVFGQSERYVEYTRDGRPKIEPPKTIIRSKYEEDVYINNHTSVWGSYYDMKNQKWGYKCCHSSIKNSYCVGQAGRDDNDLIKQNLIQNVTKEREHCSQNDVTLLNEEVEEKKEEVDDLSHKIIISKERWSKLSQKRRKRGNNLFSDDEEDMMDDRKRPYNSMMSFNEPTEEELNEYRKTKKLFEDPMSTYELNCSLKEKSQERSRERSRDLSRERQKNRSPSADKELRERKYKHNRRN